MKKLTVISAALIALSFAGIAQAQEASLHRDAVIAELKAARASGELAAIQGVSYRNGYQSTDARQMNGVAVAQEATSTTRTVAATPVYGAKTRAEVIAELKAARASGELAAIQNQGRRNSYEQGYVNASNGDSAAPVVGKTRAEVVAELKAARASGELAAIQNQGRRNSYEQGYVNASNGDSAAPVVGKTRAEVKAELQAARVSGELAVIQSNGYYTPAQARVNTSTVLAGQPRNPQ